ncbi:thioredoxin domain-containing protein [Pleionea sp. CnH1-48]|uniref:thioredoxin domain-containing protein n=1 Tax=Pleionea sp. CnH1-48 TaxID=2954494 RepID=UPI002097758C|nr:thioredoxin domain-containing protein [Pleionea sp. CnH1-48]MCO7226277.1 thioredoxin domain-containing protein [Pleionea sp. CnH1-48]
MSNEQRFHCNQLATSLSPYLSLHKEQPVHWQQWESEVIEYARQQGKPILLSIGYSACHWCHLMAQDSFGDLTTASIMNEHFINIKIDKEEQPELDKLYQQCHWILNGRNGGWPLTVFLQPDSLVPFFAGTYFPLEPENGMPSFKQLLKSIVEIFQEKPDDVAIMAEKVIHELKDLNAVKTLQAVASKPDYELFIEQLKQQHDPQWGGLVGAPKFPQPVLLLALLRVIYQIRPDESEFLYQILQRTAQGMARVGLYDHLGGGFFHYCTDPHWGIPNFEKILSDNALLLGFYASLAHFSKDGHYANLCRSSSYWMLDKMRHEQGGFFSSLGADSEEGEGTFYLWSKEEVLALLTEEEWAVANVAFGFEQAPNFLDKWHLHQWYSNESLAQKTGLHEKQIAWMLEPIKTKLLSARNMRAKPYRDEKVLTGVNGLAISGLLKSAVLLNDSHIKEAARQALSFIYLNLWKDGQLYAVYRDGVAYQSATLDDYAYLSMAIIDMLEVEWSHQWFHWLLELVDVAIEQLQSHHGGFYFAKENSIDTAPRLFDFSDGVAPSSNSVFNDCLYILALLLKNETYLTLADESCLAASANLRKSVLSHTSLLTNSINMKHNYDVVVVRGSALECMQWHGVLKRDYHPDRRVFSISDSAYKNDGPLHRFETQEAVYAQLCNVSEQEKRFDDLQDLESHLKHKP